MNAAAIVEALLGDEDGIDPKAFALRKDFEKQPLHLKMQSEPGATRRQGEGYSDQWEIPYKDWKFVVSFYEDGTQIWSAHYKTPAFSWDSDEEKAQGFSWSGSDVEKLPAGTDPRVYLARLKKMADENPSSKIWSSRRIPYMPHPEGPDRWRANY